MQQINGWLCFYKERGISSNKALQLIKRKLNITKLGYLGTLDPEAEGVLPIALGSATRTIFYAEDSLKGYEFSVQFGCETDTCDVEGEKINFTDTFPTKQNLEDSLKLFTGEISQVPPIYSAIKINGKRAYALARENKEFVIPARIVKIYKLELTNFDALNKTADFFVLCSKGTYVRSLAIDLARKCNSMCYVTEIKRTQSGKFFIKNAITLDKLEKLVHNAELKSNLESVDFALDDIPVIEISEQMKQEVLNGKKIVFKKENLSPGLYVAKTNEQLVAIGNLSAEIFQPKKVFNNL